MSDFDFMRRALALASSGVGRTGDNPSVGCVIVRDGAIIAEARTADGGRPHAEEQALLGVDARGAIAYVTLEPCARRSSGTASCAELLASAGVSCVVYAQRDPHPFASGAGPAHLRAHGVEVVGGVDEASARSLYADWLAGLEDK